jgi:uncharacterized protein (TIGR00661 family)
MRIWYGVNGVGNGHVTRSRIMARELSLAGHDVQFLVSGRQKHLYFDMEPFGNLQYRKGLTFNISHGKVNVWKTIIKNDYTTYLRDIDNLNLSSYDLIISDYEPITSWAARCQGRECVGIGHQYAFNYDIIKAGNNIVTDLIMKYYAPVTHSIGLHWDQFSGMILPPIIETKQPKKVILNKIIVYLPFENPKSIIKMLKKYRDFNFHVYGYVDADEEFNLDRLPNIYFKNPSIPKFQDDLSDCDGVICNAGFELISEALHLGKKVLTKAVKGQLEQESNAAALKKLDYALVCNQFSTHVLDNFLHHRRPIRIKFPNVATFIVKHLEDLSKLNSKSQWEDLKIETVYNDKIDDIMIL